MNEIDLRVRALELAVEVAKGDALRYAESFYQFMSGRLQAPKKRGRKNVN